MSLFNRLRRKMARQPKATKEQRPEQHRSVEAGKGKADNSAAIKHFPLEAASSLDNEPREPATIIICGGGIVGLALALALKKQLGVTAEVYEQADAFVDDVGAGMGMYPNGLRVLRDISPALLQAVRDVGLPYLYRRLERHDGTEVVVANESVLCNGDSEIESIGIRRWRLQKVLYEAALQEQIPIHFGKRTQSVNMNKYRKEGLTEVVFVDGTRRLTQVLFGSDGSHSKVREQVAPKAKLAYTGVTCIMGLAQVASAQRGISMPCATTTKCHACYFPTGEHEQCFQIHFPVPAEEADPGNWGTLSESVGKEECRKLAIKLEQDGWDAKYLEPLHHVQKAIRIGFCLMDHPLEHFVYGPNSSVVLLGDAAHPPVPYLGQGAQQGLEDVGVIVEVLKAICVDSNGRLDLTDLPHAMKVYETMRIPRAAEIIENGTFVGKMQQKRADCTKYNAAREQLLKRDVFFHESFPVLFPAVGYDYKLKVANVLELVNVLNHEPLKAVVEEDTQDSSTTASMSSELAPRNLVIKA